LFFHQNGTLAGTNYTSSDSSSDITLSVRGTIPRGAAYAKIVVGAQFNSAQGSGNVYIDDIEFEYSTEPQALSNSLFTLFSNKSDIANGWKKIDDNQIGIFQSNGGRGQIITVPKGNWGKNASVGLSQKLKIGDGTFGTKFILRGEITCLKSENVKLEVRVRSSFSLVTWPREYTETYILSPGRGTVINVTSGNEKATNALVSVRLVPINPNQPWEASIVVHNLRLNPHHNPSGPVEMMLPQQTE
jgi:hypothetical protein